MNRKDKHCFKSLRLFTQGDVKSFLKNNKGQFDAYIMKQLSMMINMINYRMKISILNTFMNFSIFLFYI